MAKLTRTSKYSDLRQGLDNDKKAYFEHVKKVEEQKRLQEIERQKQLQLQQQLLQAEQETTEQEQIPNKVEEEIKEDITQEETKELVKTGAKRKHILSYVLICLFVIIMTVSTIMWKKGLDSNKFTRVDNDNISLYKYYEADGGYLNISKSNSSFIEESEYNENGFAPSYIQIVNHSDETQKYNVVIKINDPNKVASNYEYCILIDGTIDNKDLEDKDFYFIQTISNYGGNLSDLTQDSTLSNTLLIQNGILNKNDSKCFVLYLHKIDETIQDDIDIDVLVLS